MFPLVSLYPLAIKITTKLGSPKTIKKINEHKVNFFFFLHYPTQIQTIKDREERNQIFILLTANKLTYLFTKTNTNRAYP